MAIFFLFLLTVIPGCLCCNARTMTKNKAKIVEEYVVSAKFDEKKNLPQINERNQFREIYQKDETKLRPEAKDSSILLSPTSSGNYKTSGQIIDDFEDKDTLEERDLLVHHHHVPPLPHPPPPPVGLAYAPSLFAIGLITFLILLNSLQTTLLLILRSKGSILGSVTSALGRRKRFALEHIGKPEKYEKLELSLSRGRT